MKSFFKFTFASIFGALLAVGILVLIGMGILGSIAASADKPVKVKNNSILEIKLDKQLTDRTIDNPFEKINPFSMKPESTLGLNDILKNIEKAKTDEKIKGIYLNINAISSNFGGYAAIEEIRTKLLEFKNTGKFIVSYNNLGYSQKSYYLSSVADSIYMNPQGFIMITGLGGEAVFYKKFLKKLGVEPQIVRHGKFKAAVEPFLLEKMSEANREQTMKYIGSIWNHMLEGISKQRGISVEKLNQLTDELAIRKPKAALAHKFVDGLIYEDQMNTKLKKLCGLKEKDKLRLVEMKKYTKAPGKSKGFAKEKIAVIYATGEIGFEQSNKSIGPGLATSIRKARRDSTIKAIVLRVNSPGGSALTSELIWREVELASRVKPVIASMGNVAASGGYYIACAADTIVAEPNTITGSIGIFALLFSGEDLIKNKMGLTTDSYGTNKFSNFGGGTPIPFLPFSSRKFNKEELAILQDYIEEGYDTFITRVADGREMTKKAVDNIGQGRVWAADDAKEIGLVDELGGLEKAIEIAREKAGLEKYRIVSLPKVKDPFEALIEDLTGEVKIQILQSELGENYKYYHQTQQILKSAGVQARIPYNIELN
jgi:protease-4